MKAIELIISSITCSQIISSASVPVSIDDPNPTNSADAQITFRSTFGDPLCSDLKSLAASFGVYDLVMTLPIFQGFTSEYARLASLGSNREAMDSFWKYKGSEMAPLLNLISPQVSASSKQSLPKTAELKTLIDICKKYIKVLGKVDKKIFECRRAGRNLLDMYGSGVVDLSRAASEFGALQILRLGSTPIIDASLIPISRLSNLIELHLTDTQVTDAGLVYISLMEQLEMLCLRNTLVTDAGVMHLSRLSNITWLSLGGTQVTDAVIPHLPRVSRLTWLYLDKTKVTDQRKFALMNKYRPPSLNVLL